MSPEPVFPGVFIDETPSPRAITGLPTGIAAFIGSFAAGPVGSPVRVTSFLEFEQVFGGLDATSETSYALSQFFQTGGLSAFVIRIEGAASLAGFLGSGEAGGGLAALDLVETFDILVIPEAAQLPTADMLSVYAAAEAAVARHRAMLIIDSPPDVATPDAMIAWLATNDSLRHANAAVYFPRVCVFDPLNPATPRTIGAGGSMAGLYAATDSTRGVWKAPAGTSAGLTAIDDLVYLLSDEENGALNRLGINALRRFTGHGPVCWGARTLLGADDLASDWKYIPVRRLALHIEASVARGIAFAVFEPNDEPLFAELRFAITRFLDSLFRQGAFQGAKASDAYFVRCDGATASEDERASGLVAIEIGFAPLRPAEFVTLRILQKTA